MSSPHIRSLLELRRELENELDEIRERMDKIEAFIQALDSTIGRSSFATADTAPGTSEGDTPQTPAVEGTETSPHSDQIRSISIQNKARDLELATVEIIEQNLRIIPSSHAIYDIKRGAFARFFVERILGQFQQEDRRKVEDGKVEWDEAFDFEVLAEDGILEEVVIRNFGDEKRLIEIQRALRWALEKVYHSR